MKQTVHVDFGDGERYGLRVKSWYVSQLSGEVVAKLWNAEVTGFFLGRVGSDCTLEISDLGFIHQAQLESIYTYRGGVRVDFGWTVKPEDGGKNT